jgi:signal transduction histidine kinase/PAS domain-containing protein
MAISGEQVPFLVAAGASALALASMLWALRVSDGARGAAKRFRDRSTQLEAELSEQRSILSANPGIVLVWDSAAQDTSEVEGLGAPVLMGSEAAFATLLRYTDDGISPDPAISILEGLADLEARDASGRDTTLRIALRELMDEGTSFSLTISTQQRGFIEADGRTGAGARVIVWLTDSTARHLASSTTIIKHEEMRRILAANPFAFLEMLDRAPFPAWRMSGAGKLLWANPAYVEAVEAGSMEKVLEKQIFLDAQSGEQTRKTNDTGTEIDDTRHMVVAGERRAMRVLTFPLNGGAGAMALDVSAQEAAREELARLEKAHAETLNHVADGVAIFSSERKLIFYNRSFSEMWDLDEAFLIDGPTHGQLLDRLREQRKLPARTDYAAWRADELAYYLDIDGVAEDTWSLPGKKTLSVTRQRHPMGGLLLLFKDITTELDLQTRFKAMAKTQTSTLDSLHEACAVFGGDGRLKLWNHALAEMWRLEPNNLKNEPDYSDIVEACLPLFHDTATWDEIKGHITDPSAKARQATTGEMKRSDGSILTYLTHPLPDGNTLIAMADVTATRRVESALRERAEAFEAADRLKTEFVQNVSYQLRSPLTTILGYAEFLESQRHGDLTERQADYVSAILQASDHLSKLIENILDLAMIEAGRLDLDLSDVPLGQLVEDSVEMVITKASDTQVHVHAELGDNLGMIRADEHRLRQVLFNLVSNALRFTEAGGEITVSAQRVGEMATITVTDTGKGMTPQTRATSFDSFTSGDQRGAGLGLALVHRFIDLHGGNVGIKENPEGGTIVTCWLPVVANVEAAKPKLELVEAGAA